MKHRTKGGEYEHQDQEPDPQVMKENVKRHVDDKRRYCEGPRHQDEKAEEAPQPHCARSRRKQGSARAHGRGQHQPGDEHYVPRVIDPTGAALSWVKRVVLGIKTQINSERDRAESGSEKNQAQNLTPTDEVHVRLTVTLSG